MSVINYLKGKDGRVLKDAEPDIDLAITQWDFTGTVDLDSFGTSASAGFKEAVEGNRQGTGTLQGKVKSSQAPEDVFEEGDCVTLLLRRHPTVGKQMNCKAIIGSLQVGVNVDSGEAQSFQFAFTTTGSYGWEAI